MVFVCGFMGAGKTTLARLAAIIFHTPLFDTDLLLEYWLGISVAEQLVTDLNAFRQREAELISQLALLNRGIIDLGGGAIENVNTRSLLKDKPVLFLDSGVDICWQRVQGDTQHRPLAKDYDSFVALYNKRKPLYLSICRWHLTDNLPPEQLLHKLERLIQQDNTPMD